MWGSATGAAVCATVCGVFIWLAVDTSHDVEDNRSYGGFYVGRRTLWCDVTEIVRPTTVPTNSTRGWIACGDGEWAACVNVWGTTRETPLPHPVRFGYKYPDYGRCTVENECGADYAEAINASAGFLLGNPVRCWHQLEGTTVYLKKDRAPDGTEVGYMFGAIIFGIGFLLCAMLLCIENGI